MFIFIGIVVLLCLSIIIYVILNKVIDEKSKELHNIFHAEFRLHEKDLLSQKAEFTRLKSIIHAESGELNNMIAEFNLDNGEMTKYIDHKIKSIEQLATSYILNKSEDIHKKIILILNGLLDMLQSYHNENIHSYADNIVLNDQQQEIIRVTKIIDDRWDIISLGKDIELELKAILIQNEQWLRDLRRKPIDPKAN